MIDAIYSTLPGFKNIEGWQSGLNILLAQKNRDATSKQTRNRAGKTSLVEIMHFLLGAVAGKDSIFRLPQLQEHAFGMCFDLPAGRTRVERTGGRTPKLQVTRPDGSTVAYGVDEWCALLGQQMFGLQTLEAAGGRPPTFRNLIAYFARREHSHAFIEPLKNAAMQQTGDVQSAILFLLNLDWQLARDWQAVRDQEKTLQELKKAVGKGAFGSIIGKVADLRTELTLGQARLNRLRTDIAAFQVLPQYRELEQESNDLTRRLNALADENMLDLSSIADLEAALASEVPPAMADLSAVYREAGIVLPELVTRRYEEVASFHESVLRNRKDYLDGELRAARLRIEARKTEQTTLDRRRGELMGILQSHGALDQFSRLQGELGRLEAEVEALRRRFEAAEQLEGSKNRLEIERGNLMLRLRRDFTEQRARLDEAILTFEAISQRLYESAGSMTIDVGENGPVFAFPMQGKRSKGIQNMQIFCFDMMLMQLCAKRGIGPGFLVHDSHLFDGVDGRQVISALHLGAELAQKVGFQYIVTMNEDDAFKETLTGFDLNAYVLTPRITDATDDGGLFGMRFG